MRSQYQASIFVMAAVAASTALELPALSKTIDHYDVSVTVKNAAGEYSQAVDAAALIASGLSCTSSLGVNEIETVPDKNGKLREKTFKHNGNFSLNTALFGNPQSHFDMPVNFDNRNPKVRVNVFELCTYSYESVCQREVLADDGHPYEESYSCTQTESIPLNWHCDIATADLPRNKDEAKQLSCNPPNDFGSMALFSGKPFTNLLLSFIHGKAIDINLTHAKTEMAYENYNCPSSMNMVNIDPSLAKILRFEGGVKTGMFQGDGIDYHYSINGGPEKVKRVDDGATNFDVLYCLQSARDQSIGIRLTPMHNGKAIGGTQEEVFDGTGDSRPFDFKTPFLFWNRDSTVTVKEAN